jgi:hypothetical protein
MQRNPERESVNETSPIFNPNAALGHEFEC